MTHILIAGAGKIGSLIARLLSSVDNYSIYLIDANSKTLKENTKHFPNNVQRETFDVESENASSWVQQQAFDAVVSCLPYQQNFRVAELARQLHLHYFDLTEDAKMKDLILQLSEKGSTAFVPHCGLAPGLINIAAHSLIQDFETVDTVKLRTGALPVYTSNTLGYAITWSIDGLINQYATTCYGLEKCKITAFKPLGGLETLELDGITYEAFHTSGGIGSLIHTYEGKVNTLNYKTLRYPGHAEKMRFLMQDLQLNKCRDTLKRILQDAIPSTFQDKVVLYVSVTGKINQQFTEKTFYKVIHPSKLFDQSWLAIQTGTACSAAAVVDTVLSNISKYEGFIAQESFTLKDILNNRFGMHLN
jgi:saccharopine dehydrogenase-like NADP-dependent oxidoreductase